MNLHHYRGALLDNVWLKNGFQEHKTKFGTGFSYDDIEGLFHAITIELCVSPHRLTSDGVRYLRRRLEMTQEELGKELGCSNQAIAKWEKGDIDSIPVASARLLRLLALSRVAPGVALDHALTKYNKEPAKEMVFAHSSQTGWQCVEQSGAVNSLSVRPTSALAQRIIVLSPRHSGSSLKKIANLFTPDPRQKVGTMNIHQSAYGSCNDANLNGETGEQRAA